MRMAKGIWMRVLACVLAVVACAGVALLAPTQAKADDPTYTIQVTDTKAGNTYSAFKVFDLVYSGSNYAYSINASNPFHQAVVDSGLFTLEKTGVDASNNAIYSVVLKDSSSDLSTLAAALRTTYDGLLTKPTAAATEQASADDGTVTLTVTDPGYYFVDTTTGTICSLATTDPTAEVRDKNSKPSVEKRVRETGHTSGDAGYVPQDDASIGDTVEFRTKVTVTVGAENYTLHDTLSVGLTLNANSFRYGTQADGSDAKSKGEIDADAALASYINGITETTTGLTDGCTFEIEFADALHAAFLAQCKNLWASTLARYLWLESEAVVP